METNREVKIAIIVGAIMLTACLVFFIFTRSGVEVEDMNLKVYKLHQKENGEGNEYRQCKIPTDQLVPIYKQYKRAAKLTEKSQVTGQQINGDYKLISGDNFIALDEEGYNLIYRSDTSRLYSFNSIIYDLVVEACAEEESEKDKTEKEEKPKEEAKK